MLISRSRLRLRPTADSSPSHQQAETASPKPTERCSQSWISIFSMFQQCKIQAAQNSHNNCDEALKIRLQEWETQCTRQPK